MIVIIELFDDELFEGDLGLYIWLLIIDTIDELFDNCFKIVLETNCYYYLMN